MEREERRNRGIENRQIYSYLSVVYAQCSMMLYYGNMKKLWYFTNKKDISVSFPRGRITTILGPNGSGKSTLLRLACGLLPPGEGEILLQGRKIESMKPKELARQVAMLAQSNQPPEIEVGELVSYGRYPYQRYGQGLSKEDICRIEEAMERVKISSYRHRMVNRLSGGERQRAYIAMALAQDTECIFLDEPTTYLDIHIRFELMGLVRQLHQAGKTIVMVLHDLNLALEYSHHIILMEQGKIAASGTPEEIIRSGMLDRVFQIKTHTFTEEGNSYYYFAQKE